MKIYKEEQVKMLLEKMSLVTERKNLSTSANFRHRAIEIDKLLKDITPIELPSDMLCVNCNESKPTHNICMDCIIKVGKQNIELPSDEEIVKDSKYKSLAGLGWIEGAKYLRDKIQGSNK